MILVTGGSGFLGWNLLRAAPEGTELSATFYRHPMTLPKARWIPMDLADETSIRNAVETARPSAIIHAAAMKDVDLCEDRPDQAELWNVRATEILCDAAAHIKSRVVYVSTDLVFDGSKSFWKEDDPAKGPGVYARTKEESERLVLSIPGNAVARVALLYGWSNGVNKSFIDWMWRRLGAGRNIPLFTDQYRTPVLATEAGAALLKLAMARDLEGIFHIAGPDRLNRYDFGLKVCEHFPFDQRCIQPALMSETTSFFPRPLDCSLDSSKITAALGLRFSGVDEGLDQMAAHPPSIP